MVDTWEEVPMDNEESRSSFLCCPSKGWMSEDSDDRRSIPFVVHDAIRWTYGGGGWVPNVIIPVLCRFMPGRSPGFSCRICILQVIKYRQWNCLGTITEARAYLFRREVFEPLADVSVVFAGQETLRPQGEYSPAGRGGCTGSNHLGEGVLGGSRDAMGEHVLGGGGKGLR